MITIVPFYPLVSLYANGVPVSNVNYCLRLGTAPHTHILIILGSNRQPELIPELRLDPCRVGVYGLVI
jgi:hypothetical protein